METFMIKLSSLFVLITIITGCGLTNMPVLTYIPPDYDPPAKIYPYKIKIVQFADKTQVLAENPLMSAAGKSNLAKGNDWNHSQPALTPDILTKYMAQEFNASRKFKGAIVIPSASKAAKNEIVITGDLKEVTWDCPDGPAGPLRDSCVYIIEMMLYGDIGDGGKWKQRMKLTSPAGISNMNIWQRAVYQNINETLQHLFGQYLIWLTEYLDDPIQRMIDTKTPEQITAIVDRAIETRQWGDAYQYAIGLNDDKTLTKVCKAMSTSGKGDAQVIRKFLIQGSSLAKSKRYSEAIDKYTELIAKYPAIKKAHFNRAVVLAANKKYKRAVNAMQCYTHMSPGKKELQKANDKIAGWEVLM